MGRLEQIKNEVALEKRGINFSALLYDMYPDDTYVYDVDRWDIDEIMCEAARRYATEMVRHNLERAAEQNKDLSVDAYESITSLEIELI